jgi:hypothetical protein
MFRTFFKSEVLDFWSAHMRCRFALSGPSPTHGKV